MKKCKICGKEFSPFKTTDRYCSFKCAKSDMNPKPKKVYRIKPQSEKRVKENREYMNRRKEFLSRPENRFCFVDDCTNRANTIEHTKGRLASNFLDESTWMPCCNFHNLEFERNPEMSKKYQLSKFHEGKKIEK